MVLPYGLYEPGVAEKNLLNTGGVTMFVKQIDVKTALELAAKGKEILVMESTILEPQGWLDYDHNTLENMLSGCLFFRQEPAMEIEIGHGIKTV